MPREAFRFLHAADFHLEQPLYGFSHVPADLRKEMIDAPYLAAERVFEAALLEEVDFLILAGDIINLRQAAPRGFDFLLQQFEQLYQQGIAVYWCGGEVDSPRDWPTELPLPDNVHVFHTGKVEQLTHYRDQQPLATLAGQSRQGNRSIRPGDFRGEAGDHFTIAVAHGDCDASDIAKQNISYWALGGRHRRQTVSASPHLAHYSGSSQGRCPSEAGPSGCTLVRVDAEGSTDTQFIATDSFRWLDETISVSASATEDDLRLLLAEASDRLLTDSGGQKLMVSWQIDADASRDESQADVPGDALLEWLNRQEAQSPKGLWSVSVTPQQTASYPQAWRREETILGDFLRCAERHQENAELPLDLEDFLSTAHAAGTLGEAVQFSDAAQRQRTLEEATALGVDLLRGNRVLSASTTRQRKATA